MKVLSPLLLLKPLNNNIRLSYYSKTVTSNRPTLASLDIAHVHFIDAKGTFVEKISSTSLLGTYSAAKYDLLQVGCRDEVPIIKIFPRINTKASLTSGTSPRKLPIPKSLNTISSKEKTIEMNSTIGGNDFEHKMYSLFSFLSKEMNVKVTLYLKGTSSVIELENLFSKIKTRINESKKGELVTPIQQASKKILFVIKPLSKPCTIDPAVIEPK